MNGTVTVIRRWLHRWDSVSPVSARLLVQCQPLPTVHAAVSGTVAAATH